MSTTPNPTAHPESQVSENGLGRPRVEPTSANDRTGLPRPMAIPQRQSVLHQPDQSRKLPVPWINGAAGMKGDFFAFRVDCNRAHLERRCCICGDPLNRLVAIAAGNGRAETSAGWGHPRCVSLAVNLCPHFNSDRAQTWETVAWLYEGPDCGVITPDYEDMDAIDQDAEPLDRTALRDLARGNPWGH